jgi:hypothetical protein
MQCKVVEQLKDSGFTLTTLGFPDEDGRLVKFENDPKFAALVEGKSYTISFSFTPITPSNSDSPKTS